MNWENIPREAWIGLFIAMVVMMSGGGGGLFGLMVLIGLLWFARNLLDGDNNSSNRSGGSSNRTRGQVSTPWYGEDDEVAVRPAPQRTTNAEGVQNHALEAVRAAGRDPDTLPVLPVDIGVLAYHGERDPVIHRDWGVMDDVDYIQPFVQLRLPRAATGRVRFELVDSDNQVQFVHEQDYQLERGRNLVVPAARLPVQDEQPVDRAWQIRVSADGVLLAVHEFEFEDSTTVSAEIRQHILEDGEISNDLRTALVDNNQMGKLSLDELLSFQEDDTNTVRSSSSRMPRASRSVRLDADAGADVNTEIGQQSQDGPRRISRRA